MSETQQETYVEPKTSDEIQTLEEAKARIVELEDALHPFAQIGVNMTNAGMMLQSLNRNDPPGGYWISRRDQIQMIPAFPLFSMALMRYGFGRALLAFQAGMERMQRQAIEVEDAEKELTNGATKN